MPSVPSASHVNGLGHDAVLGSQGMAQAPSTQSRLAHSWLVTHASPSASARWQLPQLGLVPSWHS